MFQYFVIIYLKNIVIQKVVIHSEWKGEKVKKYIRQISDSQPTRKNGLSYQLFVLHIKVM